MIDNIHYDIAAMLLGIALLFIFYYKKWIPSLQNKIFSALLWISLIATITDILAVYMTAYPYIYPNWVSQINLYIYFISIDSLPILYVYYILSITGIQGRFFEGMRKHLFFGPILVELFIIVSNPITQWLFYYQNGIYHRNFGVQILNGFAFYFLFFGICEMFRHRQSIGKDKFAAISSFAFFSIVPVIIQSLYPSLYITMIGVALCLFLILMTIQNPEELVSTVGLLNRSAFMSLTTIYFDKQVDFIVLVIKVCDYHYLKRVLGSGTMDSLLKESALKLRKYVLQDHYEYYIGSGQFVLFYPSPNFDENIMQAILNDFEKDMNSEKMKLNISLNIMKIHCPKEANNIDNMLDLINEFGKNGASLSPIKYAKDFSILSSVRGIEVEQAIKRGLEKNSFEVHYQPIYSTKDKKVRTAEALVRLYDENLGAISPAEFIPIAEKNGAILQIGSFVLEEVCRMIDTNKLDERHNIDYIEVNISVAQCMQKNITKDLMLIMQNYNVKPNNINFEITETVAAGSPETLFKMMEELRDYGIHFSLDDYGTGFSSMASLVDLPFKLVKIDKEMIDKIDNQRARIALRNTITMLKQLNLEIVAEGIETKEQADLLIDMGCDYLQGYYFSKPINKHQFLSFIKESKLAGSN